MIAISAWFDERSEAVVRDLWRRMAEAAVDGSLHTGSYRPHITLGVWEEVPIATASNRLMDLASGLSTFPLAFRALGIFPGHRLHQDRHPGVYLAPTVTQQLRELHERVHSVMHEVGTGSVHRHVPGRWEPHCTVAWRLTSRLVSSATQVVIDAGVLPLAATITRIGLIDTPAEIELDDFSFPEHRSVPH